MVGASALRLREPVPPPFAHLTQGRQFPRYNPRGVDMERARIFLRTTLFTAGPEPHVPAGASVLDVEVLDRSAGALVVRLERVYDERGRALGDSTSTLWLPWSKVDHVLVR